MKLYPDLQPATIKFDQSTSSEQDIIDAINATGYRVVSSSTESQ